MPRATRNTKTKSGNDASACANPPPWSNRCVNTPSNSSVDSPSAAPKERITVPMSSTGENTARSSTIRISITTRRTIGMITQLSRVEAFWMSR